MLFCVDRQDVLALVVLARSNADSPHFYQAADEHCIDVVMLLFWLLTCLRLGYCSPPLRQGRIETAVT